MGLVPEPCPPQLGWPASPAVAKVADHLDEAPPMVAGARRIRTLQRVEWFGRSGDVVEDALRRARADSRHQLHHPEP